MSLRLLRSRTTFVAVLLPLAVLVTGCEGGGDDEASPAADASSAPTSVGGADKATGGGDDYCDLLKTQLAQLNDFFKSDSSADPAAQQQFFATQKDLNAKVLEVAPAGVRADLETQLRATDAAGEAQFSRDPVALKAASDRLSSPEVKAVLSRVGAFNKDQCGIDAMASGGS